MFGKLGGDLSVVGGTGTLFQRGAVLLEGASITVGASSTDEWNGLLYVDNYFDETSPSGGTITVENIGSRGLVVVIGALTGTINVKGGIAAGGQLFPYIVLEDGLVTINSERRDNKNMAGEMIIVDYSVGEIHNHGELGGVIRIQDSQAGAGGNGGNLTGTIHVQGETGWLPCGQIIVEGDMTGVITTNTIMAGTLQVDGDMTGDLNVECLYTPGAILCDLAIGGDLTGTVIVNVDLSGDITVVDDFKVFSGTTGCASVPDAKIDIRGKLVGTGRILIDGLADGAILIGQETIRTSLIRATEGLGTNGSITINDEAGNFNANGTIHIGPTTYFVPPPITFDGSILIKKDGNGSGGGALFGAIDVIGCHDPADQLDICICCTTCPSTLVTVVQNGCDPLIPTPEWACLSGCP